MRIAVLGAGIVGLCAAEWLRRDGHEVILIDRVMPGDPAQTSYGNAGVLALNAVTPVSVPGLWLKAPRLWLDPNGPLFLRLPYLPQLLPWLMRFMANGRRDRVERISHALAALLVDPAGEHRALAEGTEAERYLSDEPYTHLFRDRAAYLADALGRRLRAEAGVAVEEIGPAELRARDPALGPAYRFAVAFPGSARVTDPGRYSEAIFAHFRRFGGQFVQAQVQEVRPVGPDASGGVEVIAGGERRSADRAILALGAWSGPFLRRLGHDPALDSERGYHLVLERPSRLPPVPYMLSDAKFVAVPMGDELRLAGLDEFGGLDAPPRRGPTAFQRRHIRRLYPDLTWEGERVWMGHRPTTSDSLPMIGESPNAPGILAAFGAHHLGLTTAPKTGRLIADLIAGRRPNIDMAPYRVGRFD